jgi:flavin-binding protein dodecin
MVILLSVQCPSIFFPPALVHKDPRLRGREWGNISLGSKIAKRKGETMPDSVYKIIEVVGSSADSWEAAAKKAVETAGKSLKDLRVAEIADLDMKVEEGKVTAFRARVKISFKYHQEED